MLTKINPNTGYTDLFHMKRNKAPGNGYVFFLKTPDGHIVKMQINGYIGVDKNKSK